MLQADLHNYFVSHAFGPAAYAVYAIGCFQVPLFGILGDSVGSIMIPRVSQLQHENRTRDIVLLTARVMRKLAAVYLPAYAFLLVMRREFIVGLFTDRYVESIPIFAINLTLIPLCMFVVDPIMRAYAEHRLFLVKLHGVLLACLTIALALSITRFGLTGAITLMVLFTYAGRAATVVKVVRILGMRAHDAVLYADVVKIAGAAAVAAGATSIFRRLVPALPPLVALAACGIGFGLVFVAAVLAAGVVTADERAVAWAYVARLTSGFRPVLAETQL
jgi:O-antigen/teichoic acid export membrane protein